MSCYSEASCTGYLGVKNRRDAFLIRDTEVYTMAVEIERIGKLYNEVVAP
jgi:hypothetical protein